MEFLIGQIINGLCQGAIYALMAVGYTTIVGVVGMVTFTFGEIIMVGAYTAYYVFGLSANNVLLGVLCSFMTAFLLGAIIYKVCYERFLRAPRHVPLLCTIGMSILLKNLVQLICGPNTKPVLNVVDNKLYGTGAFQISTMQIIIILTVIVCAILLTLLFNKTKIGIKLRAVSQDKEAANLMGINVKRTALLGNCLGCGLGGISGILLSMYYQQASANMGSTLSMKAFTSSIMGGLSDVGFSALGGVIIGVVENLGITLTTSSFRDVFAFMFLIIILLIRPQGLGSRKGRRGV